VEKTVLSTIVVAAGGFSLCLYCLADTCSAANLLFSAALPLSSYMSDADAASLMDKSVFCRNFATACSTNGYLFTFIPLLFVCANIRHTGLSAASIRSESQSLPSHCVCSQPLLVSPLQAYRRFQA
jgi:hypothetical protein